MKWKNVSLQKRMVASHTSNWWITQILKITRNSKQRSNKTKAVCVKGNWFQDKLMKTYQQLVIILVDAEPAIRKECYSTGRLR